jgi:opacity protein-like surface antigen
MRRHSLTEETTMKHKLLGAILLLALPGISQAQFNYTHVDLSFVDIDLDGGPGSLDGDGFAFSGAYTITDGFFVGGSYTDADFDFGIDGEIIRITGGYFHPLQDGTGNGQLDFVATLSFVDVDLSTGPFSAGNDGLALAGGVRYAVNEEIEVDAMVEFVDMDTGGSDTGFELRGRYYLNDEFAVSAQVDLAKDIETFRIGVRFEF